MASRGLLRRSQLLLLRTFSTKDKDTKNSNVKTETSSIGNFSRKGDGGLSKTLFGQTLQKDHRIFEAIGATEELLSFLGLAKEYAYVQNHEFTDKLKRIQMIIINTSTAVSRAGNKGNVKEVPRIYTTELEEWIQEYSKELTPPEQYIIPGGGVASASLHVARALCRRTERQVLPLVRDELVDKEVLVYLNRLSDFLLTIARIAAKKEQRSESVFIPSGKEPVQEQ